jgi:hypothetical protein
MKIPRIFQIKTLTSDVTFEFEDNRLYSRFYNGFVKAYDTAIDLFAEFS